MKKIFPLFFAIFAITHLYGQSSPSLPSEGTVISNPIPASADAAALGKYGNIPVSAYTGVPNISIPIYTIKSGDLTLPVSLSYHSAGNKVEEMASSVGLGWTLNCGGVITRTVRGLTDESTYGFFSQPNTVATIDSLYNNMGNLTQAGQSELDVLLNKVADGSIDGEPDVYNFNFGGYSGRFVMDKTGKNFFIMPQQNIRFTMTISSGQTTYISAFTAQTPDGAMYYFGTNAATEFTNTGGPNHVWSSMSWFLTRVVSPTGHEIDFNYTPEAYDITQAPGQTAYQWIGNPNGIEPQGGTPTPPVNNMNNTVTTAMHTMKISSVTFENGVIAITADSNRYDLNPQNLPTSKATAINVITIISSSAFSKVYNLYYTNNANTRLRLDSLIAQLEPIGDNNYKKEKYSFTYNADSWKPYSTDFVYEQDYWGYCNGRIGNIGGQPTLIPAIPQYTSPYNGAVVSIPGANRAPDGDSMTGSMLTQITYPTGGYTKFTYEANHEANINVGGMALENIPEVTAFSNNDSSYYYNYDINNGNPGNTMVVFSGSTIPVLVTINAGGLKGIDQPPVNEMQAGIYDSTGTGVYSINNGYATVYLKPGTYHIVFNDNKNQAYPKLPGYKYYVAATWGNTDSSLVNNFIAGGLRIKQIADYDGLNPTPFNLRTYRYTMPNDTAESSGWLDFQPAYTYELRIETPIGGQNLPPYVYSVNAYLASSAGSNYPLATTQGSVVGYSHVLEYISGGGQNGMNEYFYTNSQTDPDLGQTYGTGFPFAPPATVDWRRGLLTKETNWKQTGPGTYARVKEKASVYNQNYGNTYMAVKSGLNPKPSNFNEYTSYYTNPIAGEYGRVVFDLYLGVTDFTSLASDTTRVYDMLNPGSFVQTINTYRYDPATYQLNLLQSTGSKNELITQTVTYPNNYPPSAGGGIQKLQNLGITTFPIEEVTQRSNLDGTNARTVKAVYTAYKSTGPFRDVVSEMRSVAGLTNFVPSTTAPPAIDSHYQRVVSFDQYDTYGNILQEHQVGGASHSYLYGYNDPNPPYDNTYPIAAVANAGLADIAYTNFESYNTTGLGNWVYGNAGATFDVTAPMGSQCYTVSSSNTLSASGLTAATKYIVSYWAKAGAAVTITGGTVTFIGIGNVKSSWYYHEYNVTGTSTVTVGGTGEIDEVRLYPITAEMTTYTYEPLVGITAKCDTKNDITYYNYDNVGRLSQVLDQNRDIVKDYQYNYASQDPVWTLMGIYQCELGDGINNNGIQDEEEQDTNPYSLTYRQTQWVAIGQNLTACPVPPPPVYVKMSLYSTYTSGDTYNTYIAKSYSDAACTQPYTVPANVTVNYIVTIISGSGNTTCPQSITILAGTNSITTAAIDVTGCITCAGAGGGGQPQVRQGGVQPQVSGGGGGSGCSSNVAIAAGTGYTPEL